MKRIVIIGTSGSGKSTLAQRLSKILEIPYFASDPFWWEIGWIKTSPDKVRKLVFDVVNRESWILDGNFDDMYELIWERAECIIWLDYSFVTTLSRVIFRNIRWFITKEMIWSGNQMSLEHLISGIQHTIKCYPARRKNLPHRLEKFSKNVEVHRFRTTRETEKWVKTLKKQ